MISQWDSMISTDVFMIFDDFNDLLMIVNDSAMILKCVLNLETHLNIDVPSLYVKELACIFE